MEITVVIPDSTIEKLQKLTGQLWPEERIQSLLQQTVDIYPIVLEYLEKTGTQATSARVSGGIF